MWSLFFALLSGALLPFAFAPFHVYTFAFIAPAILCYLWLNSGPKQAFWQGLFFGLGLFCIGASWIYISIHTYGNASAPLAIFITAIFVIAMALLPATQGYIMRRLFAHKLEILQCLCIFPSTWVIWESLRSVFFTGFPWLLLGNSQLITPLRGWAPLIGVYGVSLIVALISGALALLARRNSYPVKVTAVLIIAGSVFFGWILTDHAWTQKQDGKIKVSLIQGNIPQTVKWDTNYLLNILQTYRSLTEQNWDSQLILWPEGGIPIYPQQIKFFIEDMNKQARAHHTYILTGAPFYDAQNNKYYNAALLLGAHNGHYLKHHLVPFGEYLPFPKLFSSLMQRLQIPMSDFSAGPKIQTPMIINGIKLATFICYETAFPVQVLENVKQTNLIVALIDDSWFGQSIARWQHLEISQMRALETGRYLLQATNTGITAIIDPFGRVVSRAPADKTYVLKGTVTPMQGNTPLMTMNYLPVLVLVIILVLLGLVIGI